MRQKYISHHEHYYNALKDQIGQGIPVFHGVRQMGGGLGSALGGIAKYALPLLKWLIPHAKQAAIRTITDVVGGGRTVKSALKENGIGFLKNVGSDIIGSSTGISNKTGKGIQSKGKRTYTRSKTVKKGQKIS